MDSKGAIEKFMNLAHRRAIAHGAAPWRDEDLGKLANELGEMEEGNGQEEQERRRRCNDLLHPLVLSSLCVMAQRARSGAGGLIGALRSGFGDASFWLALRREGAESILLALAQTDKSFFRVLAKELKEDTTPDWVKETGWLARPMEGDVQQGIFSACVPRRMSFAAGLACFGLCEEAAFIHRLFGGLPGTEKEMREAAATGSGKNLNFPMEKEGAFGALQKAWLMAIVNEPSGESPDTLRL